MNVSKRTEKFLNYRRDPSPEAVVSLQVEPGFIGGLRLVCVSTNNEN
jgi:hypothetical protein